MTLACWWRESVHEHQSLSAAARPAWLLEASSCCVAATLLALEWIYTWLVVHGVPDQEKLSMRIVGNVRLSVT